MRTPQTTIAITVVMLLVAGCGGGSEETQESPSPDAGAPTATAKLTEPAAEATPTPTAPREVLSTEDALATLEAISNLVIAADTSAFNFDPLNLQLKQETILDGIDGAEVTIPGLNDVKDSLASGNRELAKEQLVKVFDSFSPIGGVDDRALIVREELDQFDPNNVFAPKTFTSRTVSSIYKGAAIEVIKLYYKL